MFNFFKDREFNITPWQQRVSERPPIAHDEALRSVPHELLPKADASRRPKSVKLPGAMKAGSGPEVPIDVGDIPEDVATELGLSPREHPEEEREEIPPAPKRKKVTDKGKRPRKAVAKKRKRGERAPGAGEASTSTTTPPHLHPNFGLGAEGSDTAGHALMSQVEDDAEIRLSTYLPAGSEDLEDQGEAFNIGYALYGRDDISTLQQTDTTTLFHQGARALLRSFNLFHQAGRNFEAERAAREKLAAEAEESAQSEMEYATRISMLEASSQTATSR